MNHLGASYTKVKSVSQAVLRFVSVAYLGVVKDGDVCDVCLRILKNKKETHADNKRFNLDSKKSARLLDEYIEQSKKIQYYLYLNRTKLNQPRRCSGCDRSQAF